MQRGLTRSCAALAWGSLLVFWLSASTGHALNESPDWIYRALQTEDGLTDNRVSGVVQTDDGYLWVASRGGLLRFNGTKFTPMALPSVPRTLNRVVRLIHLDRKGQIWLWMEEGALICLGAEGAQRYSRKDGLPGGQVSAMAEDGEGAIWLAFQNSLCRVKEGKCEVFGADAGLPKQDGQTWVAADAKGELWYSQKNRLGVFREGVFQNKLTFEGSAAVRMCRGSSGLWLSVGSRLLKYEEGKEILELASLPEKTGVRALLEDHLGGLWIGTATDGLFRQFNGEIERVPTSHQEVDFLSEDREGTIWASTQGGGLNLILPRTVSLSGREEGLPSESLRSVCEDSAGGMWVVANNGKLAREFGGRWTEIDEAAGWKGGRATCLAADAKGGVWIGSNSRGVYYWKNGEWQRWSKSNGLRSNNVRSILVAKNGDVWAAMDGPRVVERFREGEWNSFFPSSPISPIRALAEVGDGTIRFGTSMGEILRVNGSELVSVPLGTQPSPASLPSIRSLHTTPDGALWIGYAGFGLGRLKDGKYAQISIGKGLMDDYASQISADGHGAMWIMGNRGLFQVSLAELQDVVEGRAVRVRSRVFGRSHGLVGLQASFDNSSSVCLTRDGCLLFATRSGLLQVRPDKIRDNPTPPPVVLETVSVDDRQVAIYDHGSALQVLDGEALLDLRSPVRNLQIPPGHQKLEIEFAALSFASPENVHYRYRLENFDQKWVEAGTRQSAGYPRLPAGKYQFRVIACNNAGVWNETGASFVFKVAPFFWQTWWFRSLVVILFTAGIIALVRYLSFRRLREKMHRLKQQAALDKERARIARDMHDEVGAKLTRLSLLSDMASGQSGLSLAAMSDVREISETARETILAFEEIVWAVNPRNDTLRDLAHYVCRHAEEFFEGSETQCVFDLPKNIPPLLLATEVRHQLFLASKEALNNVMKHAGAGLVTVRLHVHPGSFDLLIEDDGCGFDPAAPPKRFGGGNGLANMRERLRCIGGSFTCKNLPRRATQIGFHVPFA